MCVWRGALYNILYVLAILGTFESAFYVVFTMSLCALGSKQLLISLLFQIIRLDIRFACCQKLFEANL